MINALEYLYSTIYEIWFYLLNELMLGSWSNPDSAALNIFNGSLININLTWIDLSAVLTSISIVLIVYLFILFFIKLLGVFVWK